MFFFLHFLPFFQICLYDIANNVLYFSRTLDNQNSRVLSLCFHSKGFQIAVGCSDSTVRIIDVESGRCTLRISLGKAQSSETLVWDIKFLSDFTIITGSSQGKVQFWNSQFGTLKHSYQSHLADVLTLAIDREESSLYAAGVDQKVVQFKKVKDDRGTAAWVQCHGIHTHDVKSLAVVGNNCLISGGVDTELIVYGTKDFIDSKMTRYSPFCSWLNRFKFALSSNTLMYQGLNSLKFWRITPKHGQALNSSSSSCSPDKDALQSHSSNYCHSPCPSDSNLSLPSLASSVESEFLVSSGLPVNFLEIKTSTVEHILSSALSTDSRVVILSTSSKTWIYSVGVSVLCICRCDVSAGSAAIKHDNSEIVLGLAKGGLSRSKLPAVLDKHCDLTFEPLLKEKDKLSHLICKVEYSPCGKYLLALNKKFRMFVYETDSFTCLAKIPRLDDYRMPHTLFHPILPIILIFASSNKELYTFNIKDTSLVLAGSMASCSSKSTNPPLLSCMMGFSASLSPSHYLITYDINNLVLLKGKSDDSSLTGNGCTGRKRQRESSMGLPCKMFKQYKDVVFVAPLQCGELLVVEKPWDEVLKSLPPVLKRKKYAS